MKRMSQKQILGIAASPKPVVKPEPHVVIRGVPFYFRPEVHGIDISPIPAKWDWVAYQQQTDGSMKIVDRTDGEPCEGRR